MSKSAVLEPPTTDENPPYIERDHKAKPRPPQRLPPYNVIIHNDNDHTFMYVVVLLQKVFGYTVERCAKLANDIHTDGLAIVWTGHKEAAELKQDLIKSGGVDQYATQTVSYPLRCTIEPAT
jgi:ATP-dependent Clp protease adaptor protein ClpS